MSRNPKLKDLNDAFWYIRKYPMEYLPEKSLSLFNAFWMGYQWHYEVENKEHRGFALLDGFHEFMGKKFRVPSNRGSLQIAELYSQNQAEAFDLWFASLEEFLSKKDETSDIAKYYIMRRATDDSNTAIREADFFEILKIILKRPTMYFGRDAFTSTTNFILGWLRATRDFGFEETEQEKTFKRFRRYIEDRPFWLRAEQEGLDLPPTPSWNKIIWEWTAHIQKEEKALEMFTEYFDEFAFQGKESVEYVEFHWKVHHETLEKYDRFVDGKFLVGK
jgi:hypothetical protein